MQVYFPNSRLHRLFSAEKKLRREYGTELAEKIKTRVRVLLHAPSLADVPHRPPDRCHQLSGDMKGTFAVDLKHPYRLIFKPADDPVPRKEDGGIDLKAVTSIVILGVEDYH